MSTPQEMHHVDAATIKGAAGLGPTPDLAVLDQTPDLNGVGTGYNVAVEEAVAAPSIELSKTDLLFLSPILVRLQKELGNKASAPLLGRHSSFRSGRNRSPQRAKEQSPSMGPAIAPHHLKKLMGLNPRNPEHLKSFVFLLMNIRNYNPNLRGLVRQASRDLLKIRRMHQALALSLAPAPKAKKKSVLSFTGESANRLERAAGYEEEKPRPRLPSDRRIAPRRAREYEELNAELQAEKDKALRPEMTSRPPRFDEPTLTM